MSKSIVIKTCYGRLETSTVKKYIEEKLQDSCYEGVAEGASANADKAQQGLAILCQILTDKGMLNASEIVQIAGEYESEAGLVNTPS